MLLPFKCICRQLVFLVLRIIYPIFLLFLLDGDILLSSQGTIFFWSSQLDFPWALCILFLLWMHFLLKMKYFWVSCSPRLSEVSLQCFLTAYRLFHQGTKLQFKWLQPLKMVTCSEIHVNFCYKVHLPIFINGSIAYCTRILCDVMFKFTTHFLTILFISATVYHFNTRWRNWNSLLQSNIII